MPTNLPAQPIAMGPQGAHMQGAQKIKFQDKSAEKQKTVHTTQETEGKLSVFCDEDGNRRN